ncbi:hypothetical protein ACPA9J_32775 [Pseudomonas aeruginosa]
MAQELALSATNVPPSLRVSLVQNGQRRELALCELHYRQLMRQRCMRSPLESLGVRGGAGDPSRRDLLRLRRAGPVTPGRRPRAGGGGHRRVLQQADHRVPATRRAGRRRIRQARSGHRAPALRPGRRRRGSGGAQQFGLSPADLSSSTSRPTPCAAPARARRART